MFHNMPKNIVVAGRVVRQKVMASLALGGGKRGGKLLRQRLAFCLSWMYICDGFARDANPINNLIILIYHYDLQKFM